MALDGRPLRPGEFACHSCDNPPCVRPDHLFAGNNDINMADMILKGRKPRTVHTAEARAKMSAAMRRWLAEHPEEHPQRRKTHCPQGHPYDAPNTVKLAKGRGCRICIRDRVRAQHYTRRGLAVPPRK
jgi:hypothetical protein